MPDLFLELLSEEIPARMQTRAAQDLQRLVTDALIEAGLTYDGAKAFSTPRRLALAVQGIPARQPDRREEKKGPRVDAPEAAIAGFLASAGLSSVDQATRVHDPKKGEYYTATIIRTGQSSMDLLAVIIEQVIRTFPWPKSMRWGTGTLRWVRPLHGIVATFGTDIEEPDVIPLDIDGITASTRTVGHRVMAPHPLHVRRLDDWLTGLEKAKVVADSARRRDIILHDARSLALAQGLELVEDQGLLEEVAGLVEWPVPLLGRFEERFLILPPEVIRTTIRANQKCFVLRTMQGALSNAFILVANIEAADGGAAIIAGNERVVRARLADAEFFFTTDLKIPLEQRLERLESVVFHERLGTQMQRVQRIAALAQRLAPHVGADAAEAIRAARLAKADLASEMVGEFPELQGLMGSVYARAQGELEAVADAIRSHYQPQGPSDAVPVHPVAIAVALADKLDLLTGFWSIGEKPTGSRDPYALRRAALGVIRIILENRIRLGLLEWIIHALAGHAGEGTAQPDHSQARDLLAFIHDRLKVQMKDQGARHDLLDAVLAAPASVLQDDLVRITQMVANLDSFLKTPEGDALLAASRRAANILKAEEKKAGQGAFSAPPDPSILVSPAEQALHTAITTARPEVIQALDQDQPMQALALLARLGAPLEVFFDQVLVNDPDQEIRINRLRLLAATREMTYLIADFSKVT